jgi:hypothetical protein
MLQNAFDLYSARAAAASPGYETALTTGDFRAVAPGGLATARAATDAPLPAAEPLGTGCDVKGVASFLPDVSQERSGCDAQASGRAG